MIIISRGKVVADGTPDELRARERGSRYRVVVEANGVPADAIRARLGSMTGVSTLRAVRRRGRGPRLRHRRQPPPDDLRQSLFRAAVDNRWTLLELVRESASLEDVFRT